MFWCDVSICQFLVSGPVFLLFSVTMASSLSKYDSDYPLCFKKLDSLCNVCGLFYTQDQLRRITANVAHSYVNLFERAMHRDVPWAPQNICSTCRPNLVAGKSMRITTPMLWGRQRVIQQSNHDSNDCYCCLLPNFCGYSATTRRQIAYPYYVTNLTFPQWRSDLKDVPKMTLFSNDAMDIDDLVSIMCYVFLFWIVSLQPFSHFINWQNVFPN